MNGTDSNSGGLRTSRDQCSRVIARCLLLLLLSMMTVREGLLKLLWIMVMDLL